MSDPKSTAELLRDDLSAHTPVMQQYLRLTSFVNGDKGLSPTFNLMVPF